jgi:hypothetical protein
MAICLAVGAMLSFLVARGDFILAHAVRQCAQATGAQFESGGTTLWFQGHWGFQYYMEAAGASPIDVKSSALQPGARVAIPSNNTNLLPPRPEKADLLGTIVVPGPYLLTTWSQPTGAGFYASAWGPLPFAFGDVPVESVSVYVLKP